MNFTLPMRQIARAIVDMAAPLQSSLNLTTMAVGSLRHRAAPEDLAPDLNMLLVHTRGWDDMEPGEIGMTVRVVYNYNIWLIERIPDDTTGVDMSAEEIIDDHIGQIAALFPQNMWQIPIVQPGLSIELATPHAADTDDPLLDYFNTVQHRLMSGVLHVQVKAIITST